jgi:hypothetical protein
VLGEGRNFSFEVVAYNPFYLNSSIAASDNVTIDITKPDKPAIESSSHPDQNTPYDESTAVFNWSAADPISNGVASGVEGYSYLLDKHPGTAPDNNLEQRYWETLAEMHKGTYNQTLKANSTGLAYAVFSQIHTNFTENESLRVKVAIAEQSSDYSDLMGVKVYLAKAGGEGTAISNFDMESGAITNVESISQDIRYAEQMNLARVYQFELTVNETVDDNTDDFYIVVAGLPSDDDNRNFLAISGTNTSGLIDNTTDNYACDENCVACACYDGTNDIEYAIEVKRQDSGDCWTTQYDYLGDGTYYFHAKAKDIAGNWGDTEHYRILVAAGGVSSLIYSPVDGEVFTTDGSLLNVTVKVSVSDNASVHVVAVHADGSNHTSAPYIFNRSHSFENITLELGTNEIYAVTNTSSGAIAHSSSVYVTVAAEPQPPTNKTLRIAYSGCTPDAAPSYLCNRVEGSSYVGVASEDPADIAAGYVRADTSLNTLKIYMSRAFDTDSLAGQFADNSFLDRINPMFGYRHGVSDYVIRNELRYYDIHLGGYFTIPAGTYQLQLRKGGVTLDGKYNITISIE